MYILGNNSLMHLLDTLCQSLYSTKLFKPSGHKLHMKKNRRKNSPQSLCLSHMNMHTVLFHKGETELQLQGKLYNGAMPLIQLNCFMHE